jgi:hypothetical protein
MKMEDQTVEAKSGEVSTSPEQWLVDQIQRLLAAQGEMERFIAHVVRRLNTLFAVEVAAMSNPDLEKKVVACMAAQFYSLPDFQHRESFLTDLAITFVAHDEADGAALSPAAFSDFIALLNEKKAEILKIKLEERAKANPPAPLEENNEENNLSS